MPTRSISSSASWATSAAGAASASRRTADRAISTTEGPATFQAYTHPLCKIWLASEKRDGYTVATLALLAGAQLLDRLVGLEVAADRRAQRAGAVAVHDEDRVAPGHQALVDEPVDLGDRIVDESLM